MPTWPELKDYVRSKYKSMDDETEESFTLKFQFDDNRSQKLGVHLFTAYEKEFIEIRSYVCKQDQMQPLVALKKNSEFAIGALAMDDDGDICMTYSVQLDTMDPDEFEIPLRAIAMTADDLEEDYAGTDDF